MNDDERRPPLTPALALRVAIVGSVVLALFAIVFFRLWFLQVLTGSQYVRAAAVNRTRSVLIAPPRGEILDRSGKVLVNTRTALAAKIVPRELPAPLDAVSALRPPRRDRAVYARLAGVLHIPAKKKHHCKVAEPPPSCDVALGHCASSTTRNLTTIACTVAQQLALSHFADVTVKQPVSQDVQFYLAERGNLFKGVQVQQISITGYPDKDLAAQTLGTVGRITEAETKQKSFKGVNPNATVGQTGLEAQYDNYLRGAFGRQHIEINAAGQPTGHGQTVAPKAGENLQTSLDAQLQRVGEQSLQHSMGLQGSPGGAFVAINPETGGVYALGSLPSFNPNVFSHPISTRAYNHQFGAASGDPLFNRATQGGGPTGSTFKPITATAALESRAWGLNQIYDDTGTFTVGTGPSEQFRHNSGHAVYGPVDLVRALQVSDDNFFYNLGRLTNADPVGHPHGGALQTWARDFGIGRNPGIDLPNSATGTLPDPAWRQSRDTLEHECETATGEYTYVNGQGHISAHRHPGFHRNTHRPASCGIADGRPWSIGDNISLAVGQGDVQVTPLQLAVAYSAVDNGGTVVKPHIGESIQSADGTVLQKINPAPSRHINIDPSYLDAIKTGLHEAATSPSGTSYDVMGNLGLPVYGKTGTAQYTDQQDYAWYASFVPATDGKPPICVVVWVQRGSFGDIAAAPVARQILSQWFLGKPGPFIAGQSHVVVSITPIQPVDEPVAPRAARVPLLDPLLMLAAVGLVVMSALTLNGTGKIGHAESSRQIVYAGIGVALCLVLSRIDYSRLREFKYGFYALLVALNLIVYGMPAQQSVHRWIPIPFVNFQSSEFGKVLLVLALSAFMVDRSRQLHERRTTARIMLLALLAALLVIPQPDLGTGMVYVAIGFAILFFAGTSFKQIGGIVALFAAAIAIALAGAPAVGVNVVKCYQVQRLTAFMDPNSASTCAGSSEDPHYQLRQSITAIGSGQKTGQGRRASQVTGDFLPVKTSDFVFASVGEIYGFAGAALVLALYALLMWRTLRIITVSKNLYGTLIGAGILAMFMFQVFVNVGMTVGIAPITGVPLPLVSYGGSSVIVSFLAIGLLQSIYVQGRAAAAAKNRTLAL